MDGTISPILHLGGMSDGELQVTAGVSCIGSGHCIPLRECLPHLSITELAGIAAVTGAEKLAIPAVRIWQPDFNVNL